MNSADGVRDRREQVGMLSQHRKRVVVQVGQDEAQIILQGRCGDGAQGRRLSAARHADNQAVPELRPRDRDLLIGIITPQSHTVGQVFGRVEAFGQGFAHVFDHGDQPKAGVIRIRHGLAFERRAQLVQKTSLLIRFEFAADGVGKDREREGATMTLGESALRGWPAAAAVDRGRWRPARP